MKTIKLYLLFLLLPSILSLSGCAPLPNVSEKIQDAPVTQSPQIISAKGLLSPKQSKALMERLQQSVEPTDILQRYIAVIESVSESPLTKGNKVALLIDGTATYDAMFEVIRTAKDHINIETFTLEGDDIRRFADLLLQKQAEGVQVNLIYDSAGSFWTPASFFQRLRDGGVHIAEFNPINPLRPAEMEAIPSDHRKMLIVDGKVVVTGGVNISRNYWTDATDEAEKDGTRLPWRDTDVQIEGPAVAEFQKLFLDTWKRQNGGESLRPELLPRFQRRREYSGGGGRQQSGRNQPTHIYSLCFRHHFCRAFASYDECLFCPRPPDRGCPHRCC